MRKLVAIILILILFFNGFGYRFVINELQKQAGNNLEKTIDNNEYRDDELIEIKVALNMPYQERSTEFERHYGEVKIDGKIYAYVKMKVDGDTIVLKCIPNHQKQLLKNTESSLAKSNNGQDQDNNSKKNGFSFIKIFGADYEHNTSFPELQINGIISNLYATGNPFALKDLLIKIPRQPPKCWSL